MPVRRLGLSPLVLVSRALRARSTPLTAQPVALPVFDPSVKTMRVFLPFLVFSQILCSEISDRRCFFGQVDVESPIEGQGGELEGIGGVLGVERLRSFGVVAEGSGHS